MDQDGGGARARRRVRPVNDTDSLRVPPQSIEAEQAVLGGLLIDNAAWDRIADLVGVPDFYRQDHKLIFGAISRLIDSSRPADAVTVYEALRNTGKADDAGGLGYLNTLAQNTPSAANIRRYAEIVRERSVLRRLVTAGDEIATSALNPAGRETKQILDEADQPIGLHHHDPQVLLALIGGELVATAAQHVDEAADP